METDLMRNLDDITLIYDSQNDTIVFIAPNPIVFDTLDEFSLFIDTLQRQLVVYSGDEEDSESKIAHDYADKVISEWNHQIKAK